MSIEENRRGACDRCRGQKLRCVGPANPVFNSGSRYQRNEIPCERCKRAKVECYSVRSTPRSAIGSDKVQKKRVVDIRLRSEKSVPVGQHRRRLIPSHSANEIVPVLRISQIGQPLYDQLEKNSSNSYCGERNSRQAGEIDASYAVPTLSNEQTTYSGDYDTDWNDFSLETPSSMLGSDVTLCHESAVDNLIDHSTIDLRGTSTLPEWASDQWVIDANCGQIEPTRRGLLETRRQSSHEQKAKEIDRSHQKLGQNLESTKSAIQELAKLNGILLRQKSESKDASKQQDFEFGQQSIGEVLNNCQDFLSILRRLEASHLNSGFLSTSPVPTVPSLGVSTSLSILSCYAYILQSYENMFIPILDTVTGSAPTVPATLPGLCLDGFELDEHSTLQLECLTNVSLNMLEKIEKILIGSPGDGELASRGRGGLLGDDRLARLIDVLYDPSEHNAISNGNEKQLVRARQLICSIQAALKINDL